MRVGVLLAAAAVAVTVACGSHDERLSRDDYANRADAVCRRFNRETRDVGRPQTMPALARAAGRSLAPLDRALKSLRALRPPRDEEAKARQWLRQLTLLRADVARIHARAAANDAAAVRSVAVAAQQRNDRFAELAAELGMHVCNRR